MQIVVMMKGIIELEGALKKIDLHIHTVATISDSDFNFSIDKLKAPLTSARGSSY